MANWWNLRVFRKPFEFLNIVQTTFCKILKPGLGDKLRYFFPLKKPRLVGPSNCSGATKGRRKQRNWINRALVADTLTGERTDFAIFLVFPGSIPETTSISGIPRNDASDSSGYIPPGPWSFPGIFPTNHKVRSRTRWRGCTWAPCAPPPTCFCVHSTTFDLSPISVPPAGFCVHIKNP